MAPYLNWQFILGCDFGFKDGCAFSVVGWRQHERIAYVAECYKVVGMIPSEAAEEYRNLEAKYRFMRVVGDVGGLGKGYAEEMRRRYAIPVQPADKVNKLGYIDLLNGALREGLIKVVGPTCKQLIEEWLNLTWADSIQPKELPGAPNDCADATLYAWRACIAHWEQPLDPEPTPDEQARLEAARMRKEAERAYGRRSAWRRG